MGGLKLLVVTVDSSKFSTRFNKEKKLFALCYVQDKIRDDGKDVSWFGFIAFAWVIHGMNGNENLTRHCLAFTVAEASCLTIIRKYMAQ